MAGPGVYTQEKDASFTINSIESSAMATVGLFRWGPVNEAIMISTNEEEVVRRFGRPDKTTSQFFHSVANYLLYVKPLYVVRAIDDAVALNSVSSGTPALLGNEGDYETADLTGIEFVAKYPGALGNSLKISMADSSNYSTWSYASNFAYVPETDEFNLVVIDEDGQFTGTPGSVLETYELLKFADGQKKSDGTSASIKKVLTEQSSYVYVGDTSAFDFSAASGIIEFSMTGGVDGNDKTTADFVSANAVLADKNIDVIGMFGSLQPLASLSGLVDLADTRKDCVAYVAPPLSDVYNTADAYVNVKEFFDTELNKNSSYYFAVDNWKMVYDAYNDENIWIPCDSDAAALTARVFTQNEPWVSPAGLNRGQLKNVIKLAYSANDEQVGILWDSSINSVISMTGLGTVLWGDKTGLKRPSAFNRINVRNLFIVLKKSIKRASMYQLFEFNDTITRSIFRGANVRYLENVKGRRGLIDYKVVCDETNNTGQVIDNNQFIGDFYLKPNKSISEIRLNFIAVGTDVSFEEVEGV